MTPGTDKPPEILAADRLLTGLPGEQLETAAVLLAEGRIAAVGDVRAVVASAPAARLTWYDNATLLPGLIDCHAHLTCRYGEDFTAPPAYSAARERAIAAAGKLIAAGVTTVRDLGSPGTVMTDVRDAVREGRLPGPRLLVSGPPVTAPGGHMATIGLPVAGPRDAASAVRKLAAQKVDVVKVVSTGGALTPGTDLGATSLDDATISAVIAAAHGAGLPVAAHAHGTAGIEQAVGAGADTIEHCSWLRPDGSAGEAEPSVVSAMSRRGTAAVLAGPLALAESPAGPGWLAELTPGARRLLGRWDAARQLVAAGVRVAAGTDSFFGQFPAAHDLAYHAEALVRAAGWSAHDVVTMMTAGAAAALGPAGRHTGRLAVGFRADVLVTDGDPLSDIRSLRKIKDVLVGGRRVNGGGRRHNSEEVSEVG